MNFINKKNHKLLYIAPIIIGIISLILIFLFPKVSTGIDFKGGNQIIIRYEGEAVDSTEISDFLKTEFDLREVSVSETKGPTTVGLIIEYSNSPDIEFAKSEKNKLDFTNTNIEDLKQNIITILTPLQEKDYLSSQEITDLSHLRTKEDLKLELNQALVKANSVFIDQVILKVKTKLSLTDLLDDKIQTREVSPTLGKDFIKASLKVGVVAFLLLSVVIFLFFRKVLPSGLIIFAAIFDVVVALGGMAILNLPLSLTTIPTLLMLLGYSVDTNILLSTNLLKNKTEDVYKVTNNSMNTGLTMTITTLITVLVMLIISYFMQMTVILEIAAILFFGLVGDIFATWFFNAPALISYVQNKNKTKGV